MSAIKDQAVCLRRMEYSETSQLVTLFARASGKIRALAKGSRRTKGRFGGGIELLSAGVILFIPAKGDSSLVTLSEFELQESFSGLRRRLLNLYCAQYAADLLVEFTEDQDPQNTLYDAFYQTLAELEQTEVPVKVLVSFEAALLRDVGLTPQWHRCCQCARQLPENRRLYFSSSHGGMLCRECEPHVQEKRFVEPEVIKVLQNTQALETADPRIIVEAHEVLSYHQRELLGKQTHIMKFVNPLLRQVRKAKK
jgi:DNA repair protein RecO (recombination protein O)